jgi:hypothetical protein
MVIVRSQDRPVLTRGPELPTLQRLVDRANGAEAVSVLINTFTATHSIAHGSEHPCTVVAVLGSADATLWSE